MAHWWDLLMVLCAVGCGVVAGVFFVFSTFVMQGLARVDRAEGMRAMQAINITAVRPALMGLMFGTAILCIAAITWSVVRWGEAGSAWATGGAVLYLVGVMGVTIGFHVRRNDRLAGLEAESEAGRAYWGVYQRQWVRGNHIRTVAPVVAMICFLLAMRG